MPEQAYIPRLKTQYTDVIKGELTKEFGYKNVMQVPQLDKVVLNMGIGQAVADSKKVQSAAADLALIAGQKPVVTKARKSIATFKLREGMPIGVKALPDTPANREAVQQAVARRPSRRREPR